MRVVFGIIPLFVNYGIPPSAVEKKGFPATFAYMTIKNTSFYDRQLEKDNRAIEKIQKAKSAREIKRIEKDWHKEEQQDRIAFERQTRHDW